MSPGRARSIAAWFFQMLASAAWVISVIEYDSWDAGEPRLLWCNALELNCPHHRSSCVSGSSCRTELATPWAQHQTTGGVEGGEGGNVVPGVGGASLPIDVKLTWCPRLAPASAPSPISHPSCPSHRRVHPAAQRHCRGLPSDHRGVVLVCVQPAGCSGPDGP